MRCMGRLPSGLSTSPVLTRSRAASPPGARIRSGMGSPAVPTGRSNWTLPADRPVQRQRQRQHARAQAQARGRRSPASACLRMATTHLWRLETGAIKGVARAVRSKCYLSNIVKSHFSTSSLALSPMHACTHTDLSLFSPCGVEYVLQLR